MTILEIIKMAFGVFVNVYEKPTKPTKAVVMRRSAKKERRKHYEAHKKNKSRH